MTFELNRRRVILEGGSCWYLRLSDPHSVANRGDADRVYLVIDAGVNEWAKPHSQRRPDDSPPMRPPAFERFRALVERDPPLQEELHRPDDPAVFAALVIGRARNHGLDLGPGELATAMEARRPALIGDGDGRLPPRGWLPVQTRWRDQILEVDWAYLGSWRLCEPFFEDSVLRCLTKPFNRLFGYSTPINALAGWSQDHPGLAPDGFIFHMSRCGSTLLSQMLAAVPRNIVVSEAGPIDAVVQAKRHRPDLCDAQHAAWLRWIIGALGQARSDKERHFFVKLDSWHTLALPLFRRAFPSVPWIFLYRDPLEVLVSQLKRRGIHMVPGLLDHAFGFDASHATQPPEIYCAQVLERICDGVLREYAPGRALLVDYQQLPAALWTDVLPHFGWHAARTIAPPWRQRRVTTPSSRSCPSSAIPWPSATSPPKGSVPPPNSSADFMPDSKRCGWAADWAAQGRLQFGAAARYLRSHRGRNARASLRRIATVQADVRAGRWATRLA